MPSERIQFRILYRDFLRRVFDLEVLSAQGDLQRLLVQFASLLAALNFSFFIFAGPKFLTGQIPAAEVSGAIAADLEFLVAGTMAVAGLFSVLAWNNVLPDRRDTLILGLLPVRTRTVFLAKVASIATALGIAIVAANLFTGITYPFFGLVNPIRSFAVYWLTMAAAGTFVCCATLALQGIAAQVLPYRLFLRASSFLQLAAFFGVLAAFFLKPPGTPAWLPSSWFFGFEQDWSGSSHNALASRAFWALLIASVAAAGSFAFSYTRGIRQMVEQPDILPETRRRRSNWLAYALLRHPIDRAIVMFTARTVARSRQHRLFLAAYGGIGLAVAFAYAHDLLYGTDDPFARSQAMHWNQTNAPMLMAGFVLLCFAIAGTRAVFSLPVALRANWAFQLTAVQSPALYLYAIRKALVAVAVLPLWLICGTAYFLAWPSISAAQHMAILTIVAFLTVHRSLVNFRKIPFACSYLPGKSNLHVKVGVYALGFVAISSFAVQIEYEAMRSTIGFPVYGAIWATAAVWAWRRWKEFAEAPYNWSQFEDTPDADVESLDLHNAPKPVRSALPRPSEPTAARPYSILTAQAPLESDSVPIGVRLTQLATDLLTGFRIFRRAPGFSAAAIALMAVGIGGNTVVYSLINSILNKPAPGIRAENLVNITAMSPGNPNADVIALPLYANFLQDVHTLQGTAAASFERVAMTAADGTAELRGLLVTPNYFDLLGVPIVRGRGFTPEEARGSAGLAAVIAWHVWENQFHSAPDVVGRQMLFNGIPATIVGVSARGFRGTHFGPSCEIAVPMEAYVRLHGNPGGLLRLGVEVIGRLAPDVPLEQSQAELDAISQRIAAAHPEFAGKRVIAMAYSSTAFGPWQGAQTRMFMRLLTAVALLTLLVVCANVANLMLGRSAARERELAVRQSLGASRGRILSLLLGEGLALSVTAAAAAWMFAWWVAQAIPSLIPPLESGARIEPDLAPDWRVGVYAFGLAVFGALIFTLAPSVRSWRQELLPFLKAGEHGVVQGRSRMANVLVVVQLAFCVLLLGGAGLATRSAQTIHSADLGFPKERRLILRLNTVAAPAGQDRRALLEDLRRRIGGLPGVAAVSYASAVPPDPFGQMNFSIGQKEANGMVAGPRYLDALGLPVRGRDFAENDAGHDVAILTRRMEQILTPGQSALGRTIELFGRPYEVIGIAPDAAYSGLREEGGDRFIFVSHVDDTGPGAGVQYFNIRYSGPLGPVAAAIRAVVRDAAASERIVGTVQTMDSVLQKYTAPSMIVSSLLGVFSAGSLVVAGIGLYAVIAFHTARRRREFGIRMALGATSGNLLATVLREGLVLSAIGCGAGLALCAAVTTLLRGFLFGVSPMDPITWTAVLLLLAVASLAACYVPARRAGRIQPLDALRQE